MQAALRPPIRIVLTGGPCAGKTSALAHLRSALMRHDLHVYLVPEAATLLAQMGASLRDGSADYVFALQESLLKVLIQMEEAAVRIATATSSAVVILSDRGTMDASAYMPDGQWEALLALAGWTVPGLCEDRYDAVIHLVTAADGAEGYYQTNSIRTETPAEARTLDRRVLKAWSRHPRLRVIDNQTDFAAKLDRTVAALMDVIGARNDRGITSIDQEYRDRPFDNTTFHPAQPH
jgi:predicted ATPase